LVRIVKGFEIFTEICKLKLKSFGFGNKFYWKGSNYEKGVIIRKEFWSINDFILQNWEACVDIIFLYESKKTNRQSGRYGVESIRRLPMIDDADGRVIGEGSC